MEGQIANAAAVMASQTLSWSDVELVSATVEEFMSVWSAWDRSATPAGPLASISGEHEDIMSQLQGETQRATQEFREHAKSSKAALVRMGETFDERNPGPEDHARKKAKREALQSLKKDQQSQWSHLKHEMQFATWRQSLQAYDKERKLPDFLERVTNKMIARARDEEMAELSEAQLHRIGHVVYHEVVALYSVRLEL